MFLSQETCGNIGKALIEKNGLGIVVGLLSSLGIAIFFGLFFVKNFIKFLQQQTENDFKLSKDKYSARLKDKWIHWVSNPSVSKYNAWLGSSETILFYICLLFDKPEGIGAWLIFKVATKWESWTNIVKFPEKIEKVDDFEYLELRDNLATVVLQRFLIGTILNMLGAFIGVAIFSMIRISLITEGLIQKFWLIAGIGIIVILIYMYKFKVCIIDKLPKEEKNS